MENAKVVSRCPTPEEFIALRRAAGWHVPDARAAAEALRNSVFAVCIEKGRECVGMGRVVGDGALVFYVQDVIVVPEQQRQGYGTMMMDAIMDFIANTAEPTACIGLFSARGLEPRYGRYGFIERPHKHLGPGMVFFKQ
jgi:GNAT superfamily N-acetyltransferase